VTWIGYPNTTGMSAMDYRITDAYADPPGLTEHLHSERLLRMPDIYLPCEAPEERIPPTPPPCSARGYVTFGSFNTLAKVSGRTIALWARVLEAMPGSRLMVMTVPEGRTRARLRDVFAKHGIAGDRLDLRGRLAHPEFLQAHADADVALDAFPYHGTTTTVHTLWMGVPLVTLAGTTHVSRVGVSMLTNVGLSDLVATTEEDYVRRAVGLASDAPRLRSLRATLRERMENGPVMDGLRFTRSLERLYASIAYE
jgi:protein O-GlcNAc transferase